MRTKPSNRVQAARRLRRMDGHRCTVAKLKLRPRSPGLSGVRFRGVHIYPALDSGGGGACLAVLSCTPQVRRTRCAPFGRKSPKDFPTCPSMLHRALVVGPDMRLRPAPVLPIRAKFGAHMGLEPIIGCARFSPSDRFPSPDSYSRPIRSWSRHHLEARACAALSLLVTPPLTFAPLALRKLGTDLSATRHPYSHAQRVPGWSSQLGLGKTGRELQVGRPYLSRVSRRERSRFDP